MQQAEVMPNNPSDFDGSQTAVQDENLLVRFFHKSRPNKAKDPKDPETDKLPNFVEVEYIDIRVPGERGAGFSGPATHEYTQRFPRHYAAFKQRIEAPVNGTPLTEWPGVSRAQAEELAFHNVKTVEQLAGMADVNAQKFLGIAALKTKATVYLAAEKDGQASAHLAAELDDRDAKITALEDRLVKMEAALQGNAPVEATPSDDVPEQVEIEGGEPEPEVEAKAAPKRAGRKTPVRKSRRKA